MKKTMAALFMLMSMCCNAGLAFAAAAPVIVMHAQTGSNEGKTKTTLNFTVHVVNPGDAPISNLALSLVPLPPLMPGRVTLNVASLDPHQSVYLPLQVTATSPAFLNADEISRRLLFWSGKCVDADGTPVEFPVTSHPEGVE